MYLVYSLVQLNALLEPVPGLPADRALQVLPGHVPVLVDAGPVRYVVGVAGQLLVGVVGHEGEPELLQDRLVVSDDLSLVLEVLYLELLALPVLVRSVHYKVKIN